VKTLKSLLIVLSAAFLLTSCSPPVPKGQPVKVGEFNDGTALWCVQVYSWGNSDRVYMLVKPDGSTGNTSASETSGKTHKTVGAASLEWKPADGSGLKWKEGTRLEDP